jgi:hypothetical protein
MARQMTPAESAELLERLARLEAAEEARIAERERKRPVNNRRTKDLGVKQGYRLCVDPACDWQYVRVPVELRGTEVEVLARDVYGNLLDHAENSTLTYDFANPDDAICEGCGKHVGMVTPGGEPLPGVPDDITALHRRRVKLGDDTPQDIAADTKRLRERQAAVLAKLKEQEKSV